MSDAGYCECGCGERTKLITQTNRALGRVKGEYARYVQGHQRRGKKTWTDPAPRFWSNVEKTDDCWEWKGWIVNGYGRMGARGTYVYAHRFAYEEIVGPIPEGLFIDHLCRNKACVNPAHLEPVTHLENVRRGLKGVLLTHCPQGHEKTPENTMSTTQGPRCKPCSLQKNRESYYRHREEILARRRERKIRSDLAPIEKRAA